MIFLQVLLYNFAPLSEWSNPSHFINFSVVLMLLGTKPNIQICLPEYKQLNLVLTPGLDM